MFRKFGVPKTAGLGLAVVAALGLCFTLVAPTMAQSAVQQLISFACFDHRQCLSITNSSDDGKAIVGVAQNASAIVGRANGSSNTGSDNTVGGVWGIDTSTNQMDFHIGVLGSSTNGTGGLFSTSFDSSVNGFGQTGVAGFDNSTTYNENSGVAGISNNSDGVFGLVTTGVPTEGCDNRCNILSGTGVYGENDGGNGVFGTGVPGVFAIGQSNLYPAFVIARFGPTVPSPLIWAFGDDDKKVLSLDSGGNLIITGKLIQHGTPMAVADTSRGNQLVTYAPQQSVQTMEDVGEAQLVGGQAMVRLEPAFASAIDTRRSYLVFITPQGETNSLYVTQKTAVGFVVRERNGVSNAVFDYRIVAQPYGQAVGQRLALYRGANDAATDVTVLRSMRQSLARAHLKQAHFQHAYRRIFR
jgi:hypothetical protein